MKATMVLIAAMLAGGLTIAACEDDPECETNADCDEVVCADGIKHKECTEGSCFVAEDCAPANGGGW
jgi:hypothetical protein